MNKHLGLKDSFWKLYITAIIIAVVVFMVFIYYIFNLKSSEINSNALSEKQFRSVDKATFVETPNIYEDVLTYGWDNWSWNTDVNFSSSVSSITATTTTKLIEATFLGPNTGFMIHAPRFDTVKYNTLHLSVFTQDLASSTLYIELTDVSGTSLGSQLISWYTTDKAMLPNTLYKIVIPLNNLNASKKIISGISITSSTAGTLYIDDINFGTDELVVSPWIMPIENQLIPEDIAPISLSNEFGSSTPYVNNFFIDVGNWRAAVGSIRRTHGRFDLTSSTTNKTSSYLLLGGDLWKDYKFSISVNWAQADSISLLSRYYDSSNYFSCSFYDDGVNVTLYQVIGGKQKEITSFPHVGTKRLYLWTDVQDLSMSVKDNEVSCMSDGKTKIKYKVPYPISGIGGVGIEMWSPDTSSSLSISKAVVEPLQ